MSDETMTHISSQDALPGHIDDYIEHIITEFLSQLTNKDGLVDSVKAINPRADVPYERVGVMSPRSHPDPHQHNYLWKLPKERAK